jgi:hypothetical protein
MAPQTTNTYIPAPKLPTAFLLRQFVLSKWIVARDSFSLKARKDPLLVFEILPVVGLHNFSSNGYLQPILRPSSIWVCMPPRCRKVLLLCPMLAPLLTREK